MSITHVFSLLGGLALFLYGMDLMGKSLERQAGSRLQKILARLTENPFKGFLLGLAVTAVIQSSSATTVMVVGFVNSGIMELHQAIGIIMGSNVGTTVTSWILSLTGLEGDSLLIQLLKPSTFSPLLAFVGILLFMFGGEKKKGAGGILIGFAILMTGMTAMSDAVSPLEDEPWFTELFVRFSNPILGVLVGALVTAVIQSSSASVGILQALSSTGVVTWGSAIPIILGQNIGTCSTPLIASMGASTAAKRSAIVHLYFNVIGTAVFLAGVYGLKAAGLFPFWNDVMTKGDIANFHTLFNVVVTLLFMPFTKALAWLAERTIPEKEGEAADLSMPVLDQRLLQSPAVALQQAKNAVEKMASRTRTNFDKTVGLFTKFDAEVAASVAHREELLDKMEVSITDYLIRISDQELTESESHAVSELLKFVGEYERIGDYTVNLMDCARQLSEQEWSFSPSARKQAALLFEAVGEVQRVAGEAFTQADAALAAQVEPLEETVDRMCDLMREEHITRLKAGECGIEPGLLFLDVLTNTERISDHCSNIAARLIGDETDDPDMHARKHSLLAGKDAAFNARLATYEQKYLAPLTK